MKKILTPRNFIILCTVLYFVLRQLIKTINRDFVPFYLDFPAVLKIILLVNLILLTYFLLLEIVKLSKRLKLVVIPLLFFSLFNLYSYALPLSFYGFSEIFMSEYKMTGTFYSPDQKSAVFVIDEYFLNPFDSDYIKILTISSQPFYIAKYFHEIDIIAGDEWPRDNKSVRWINNSEFEFIEDKSKYVCNIQKLKSRDDCKKNSDSNSTQK